MDSQDNRGNYQVVVTQKSMAVTIILTVLFGPFGMFYSTILGGIVMLILGAIITLITFGFGVLFIWPICIIWAAIATDKYNKELLRR